MASFLVLLSGDLSLKPGPTGNFYDAADLPKLHGLKIAQLNVQSILNKMDNVGLLLITNVLISSHFLRHG